MHTVMMYHTGSTGQSPVADEQAPLDRALALAGQGIPVFPCNPDKTPKVRWREAATTEAAQIERWWALWPDALPAVPTGRPSQIWVVDLDIDDETGEAVGEATMERIGLPPGRHPHRVMTPSGGQHLYYKWGDDLPGNAVKILPGVDLRGEGGYVIAWQTRGLPSLDRLWEPPQRLLDAIGTARRKPEPQPRPFIIDTGERPTVDGASPWAQAAFCNEIAKLRATAEGGRNDQLNRAAFALGQLVAAGHLDRATVESELRAAALAIGLEAGEIEATLASGLGAGMEQPRGPATRQLAAPGEEGGKPAEDDGPLFAPASRLLSLPAPPREWHVEPLVPSGTVTMLNADGGDGKSLLAKQLAAATAAGRAWLGYPVRQGPALYLSAEDDTDELHRRLAVISERMAIPAAALADLHIRSLAGEDAVLAQLDRKTGALVPTPLFDRLDEAMGDLKPKFLGLDTLADLHTGQENERTHARQFIGLLRGLAIRHRCAVLLLAHPSLAGRANGSGLSGSTAWNASVRSRLYLERVREGDYEPDPDARRLRCVKSNYGPTGGEITLRWRDGIFVADAPAAGLDRMAASAKARRVFMRLLRQLTSQGLKLNPSAGASYAPTVMAAHAEAEGVTKQALRRAMQECLASGEAVIETTGPASRQTTRIVPGVDK